MGMARLIRRTAPLVVVGLAGAVAARRRAERLRQARLVPALYPPPEVHVEPVVEAEPVVEMEPVVEAEAVPDPEPEPEPEPEPPAAEHETAETAALAPWLEEAGEDEEPAPDEPEAADAASVTEIVDDLLAPGDGGEHIEDATVVEGGEDEDQPDDEALSAAVRAVLAEQPGLLPGTVQIDVERGNVRLSGEVERVEAITELERRAGEVAGIRSVKSFVHLPGTPPPAAGEHR